MSYFLLGFTHKICIDNTREILNYSLFRL